MKQAGKSDILLAKPIIKGDDAMLKLEQLATEKINPLTRHIDTLNTLELAALINQEDAKVATAVREFDTSKQKKCLSALVIIAISLSNFSF